jgi:ABC-type lipoprotein release transport system permease subunit
MVWELAMHVAWIVAGGALIGLAMTVIAQHQLRAMVFGVAALDPMTLIASIGGLMLSAGVATLIPAFRAASIDPVGAMRDGG